MSRTRLTLVAFALFASTGALARPQPVVISPAPAPVWPSPHQLGDGPSDRFPCFRSFDKGVAAIEAGFTQDGVRCFQSAAKRGDVRAMRAIGLMLQNGLLSPREGETAPSWYYEAALLGDAQSMHLLGEAFQSGIGVTPDTALAAFWLQRAKEKGYVPPRQ